MVRLNLSVLFVCPEYPQLSSAERFYMLLHHWPMFLITKNTFEKRRIIYAEWEMQPEF